MLKWKRPYLDTQGTAEALDCTKSKPLANLAFPASRPGPKTEALDVKVKSFLTTGLGSIKGGRRTPPKQIRLTKYQIRLTSQKVCLTDLRFV